MSGITLGSRSAHLFNVGAGHEPRHVDSNTTTPPLGLNPNDYCVMAYLSKGRDDIVEFDIECLYDIRDARDPI